jgi:hypothetical protein
LGGIQAAAAAMNPQFAPYLIQQANAPAQAKYQQQQAAFEAAMQGQQHALTAGTQLIGQGSKEDIARMMEQGRQGQNDISNQLRMLQLMLTSQRDQNTANKPSPETSWNVVGPDVNNDYWQINPKTGEKRKTGILGRPSAQSSAAGTNIQATQDTLDELRSLYQQSAGVPASTENINGTQVNVPAIPGQSSMMERNAQEFMQKIPIVRNFAGALDPLAQRFQGAKDRLILQFNKPVTGSARLMQAEIIKMANSIPDIGTSTAVAIPQIAKLQKLVDSFYAAQGQGAGRSSPTGQSAAPGGQRKTAAQLADEMGLK